jgi:ATP-dependent DNA helicase RecQ
MLNYFGEEYSGFCGNCSNCSEEYETKDITVEAQKILSCVARTSERYGVNMIADILCGSKNEKLLNAGLDKQTTYGLMPDMTVKSVCGLINELKRQKLLAAADTEYPVLKLTDKSKEVLFHSAQVKMRVYSAKEEKAKTKKQDPEYGIDAGLLGELKNLRKKIASVSSVPAFVVFADSTLLDMCRKLPRTESEFLEVSGVGRIKFERYGEQFIDLINDYLSKNPINNPTERSQK